ncbi:hypothetical protein [Kordia sp.]|uniref:tetratricopeptide repeat protein n=1 Tax=Kordia sp. TaxID=1965332 RepID=UPI0025C10BC6|nr:hypothetical protein [Kordia sp.]MCH2193379.1 hypothetical protein [Kordia sp.]
MKKTLFTIFLSFTCITIHAQTGIENNSEAIKKAQAALASDLEYFFSDCLVYKDCEDCINELVSKAKNPYQQYLVGGALYSIAPKISYDLHKKAFESKPNERNFNLEYALESHRIEDYKTAIKHYKVYKKAVPQDYRLHVWLSECYLQLDNYQKAIEHWNAANHPKNHTGIDKAIYIIHGDAEQVRKRSELLKKIKTKDARSAYELIFLDMNWELDWWNNNVQEYFLEKDIATIKDVFGETSKEYLQLAAYKKIKKLSEDFDPEATKAAFLEAKLVLDNNEIPVNGNIASDLLRISFLNKFLDEKTFFEERGNEIVQLADTYIDIELLNIYAYLEAVVLGHVSPETDKKGWNEYKSEKFAISYFIGLADKNTYDNPDLTKALKDFPNSSKIHWVKLNCAKIERRDIKEDLIEVLKKEFKTLGSDPSNYSYALKSYFYILETKP